MRAHCSVFPKGPGLFEYRAFTSAGAVPAASALFLLPDTVEQPARCYSDVFEAIAVPRGWQQAMIATSVRMQRRLIALLAHQIKLLPSSFSYEETHVSGIRFFRSDPSAPLFKRRGTLHVRQKYQARSHSSPANLREGDRTSVRCRGVDRLAEKPVSKLNRLPRPSPHRDLGGIRRELVAAEIEAVGRAFQRLAVGVRSVVGPGLPAQAAGMD